jgi:glucan phosphoethanolaminetransferase (alkaline phosphatase superfamily)
MTERLIPLKLQLFAIGFSVLLIVFIVELIRKNHLTEGYSILWFGLALSLFAISVWTDLLRKISYLVGVEYEPVTLLAILVLGMILLMIHFSVLVSGFDRKNKTLAQYVGLLEWELKQLRNEVQEIRKSSTRLNGENQEMEEIPASQRYDNLAR